MSVSIYTGPYGPYQEGTENALYVQDQWTMRRMTLNLGLRYSVYDVVIPESHLPAGPYVPARDFPEVEAFAPLGKSQPAGGRRLRPVWDWQDGDQGGAGPVSSPQHGRRRKPPGVESAHKHDEELERQFSAPGTREAGISCPIAI